MLKIKEHSETISELGKDLEKGEEEVNFKGEDNIKLLESIKDLRDHYFGIASWCCDRLKKVFSSAGGTSRESSYTTRDVSKALVWMEELKELKGVMNARGAYCAMVGFYDGEGRL